MQFKVGKQTNKKIKRIITRPYRTFDFFVDGKKVTRRSPITKECYFGELALLYDSPRQASAVCVSGRNIPEGNAITTQQSIQLIFNKAKRKKKTKKKQKQRYGRSIVILSAIFSQAQQSKLVN